METRKMEGELETVITKESPILFSTDMVKAILEGRKTMTRRILRPQPDLGLDPFESYSHITVGNYSPALIDKNGEMYPGEEIFGAYTDDGEWGWKCPYEQAGDRLWVRETWKPYNCMGGIAYKADGDLSTGFNWKPSIHMFRKDSRVNLEITGVRVERLQEITFDDMLAEGARYPVTGEGSNVLRITGKHPPSDYLNKKDFKPKSFHYIGTEENWLKAHFAGLWDDLNAKRGYSWSVNPWVWVIEFKMVPK